MLFSKLSVSIIALTAAVSLTALAAETPPVPGEALIPPTSIKSAQAQPANTAPAQPASPSQPAAPAQAANQAPAATPAAPQQPAAAPGQPAQKFSSEQLDQLLAPVALYPDQLLGQVLMASTYPLEVVEAARWAADAANRRLQGNARFDAMKAKGWDPSVMALVPFERVLNVMSVRLDWLRDLGTAFVAQQVDVMASVQRLRHLAMVAGNLKQTPQCHCTIATEGGQITIAAADTGPVCVPAYNTRVAYGRWPYPRNPPIWFPPPPSLVYVPGIAVGFYPVIDVAWWYAPLWGWDRIDWGAGHIVVDQARYAVLGARESGFAGGVWVHDPARAGAIGALGVAAAARGAAVALGNRAAIAGPGAARVGIPGAVGRGRGFAAGGLAARGYAARGYAGHGYAARGFAGRGYAAHGYAARGYAHAGPRYAGRFGGFGGHFAGRSVAHFGGFGGGGGHFGGGFHGGGGGGFHGGGGGGFHGGGGGGGGGHHH